MLPVLLQQIKGEKHSPGNSLISYVCCNQAHNIIPVGAIPLPENASSVIKTKQVM